MSTDAKFAAIIPAAGSGERMGAGVPKVLRELQGEPLLLRVLNTFHKVSRISRIVMPCLEAERPRFEQYASRFPNVIVIAGGATRQQSVALGVEALSRALPPPDYVVVHDAARALVSQALIEQSLNAVQEWKALTCAVPVFDSLLRVDAAQRRESEVPRERVWAVQTPQAFSFELLKAAHARGASDVATDDASLVALLHEVRVIPGDRSNIKITTAQDLEFAARLLITAPLP